MWRWKKNNYSKRKKGVPQGQGIDDADDEPYDKDGKDDKDKDTDDDDNDDTE
jgi:hypothetical protein